ncbi:MAG TPA: sodium ion-translocating decarboxylase subunit beta [Anaerolineae bacterium]|nr:sodium ion-translocating decarboxylase subunit beta [Anaerolineae bacterium]MCB9106606.1 sodium ion-translocating decarboxylase subunit beta [Anaerolineales bacterium]HRV92613.1 sodium ion-translocating decarboxylase subunit beta [Anaerolineae bacterium]
MELFLGYLQDTGFNYFTIGNIIMVVVGLTFVYLGIARGFEPLLLIPIGFGMVVGNVPFPPGFELGIYEEGSVMNYLYFGVVRGIYPPIIFLGIGAMTDFSALVAQPRLILLGAAAQMGIFATFLAALYIGGSIGVLGLADPNNPMRLFQASGSIAIIGGADGPTAIFLTSMLAPDLLGAIAVSAYSYMALVPVIQPPIMRLLTTEEERKIRMPAPPVPSRFKRLLFPIITYVICVLIAPGSLPLLSMLLLGNLLKESAVTDRLANTARNALIDSVTIILGLTIGVSTQADTFLKPQSVVIFAMGAVAFMIGTASGVLFAKLMNMFSSNKINPLIGSAGVSAVPMAARVSHVEGQKADPQNFLIVHAMAPNVAGVIGSAVAAGVLLSMLQG